MSTKEFTPGPWSPFTSDGHTNIVAVIPRTTVVFSLPGRDKSEPDVRLMAKAPELLDALEEAFRVIDSMKQHAETAAFWDEPAMVEAFGEISQQGLDGTTEIRRVLEAAGWKP